MATYTERKLSGVHVVWEGGWSVRVCMWCGGDWRGVRGCACGVGEGGGSAARCVRAWCGRVSSVRGSCEEVDEICGGKICGARKIVDRVKEWLRSDTKHGGKDGHNKENAGTNLKGSPHIMMPLLTPHITLLSTEKSMPLMIFFHLCSHNTSVSVKNLLTQTHTINMSERQPRARLRRVRRDALRWKRCICRWQLYSMLIIHFKTYCIHEWRLGA